MWTVVSVCNLHRSRFQVKDLGGSEMLNHLPSVSNNNLSRSRPGGIAYKKHLQPHSGALRSRVEVSDVED